MSHEFDPITNNSNNEHFQEVLNRALENPTRRSILRGGVGLASMFALPMLPGCGAGSGSSAAGLPVLAASSSLAFTAVSKSILDKVVLPTGYTAKVLHATGDTLNTSAAAYTNAGTESGDSWENRVGDHHDGMQLFYIDASNKATYTATTKAVIAVNHESSADAHFLNSTGQTSGGVSGKKFDQFGRSPTAWDAKNRPGDEVLKEIFLHGISIVEVTLDNGKPTGYKADSTLNRRITPQTVIDVTGPADHLSNLKERNAWPWVGLHTKLAYAAHPLWASLCLFTWVATVVTNTSTSS